jgi:hypothetical protein
LVFARCEAAVRVEGAAFRDRTAVPVEHRPVPPARDLHQVTFVAAVGEPLMRESVPELVRVPCGYGRRFTRSETTFGL